MKRLAVIGAGSAGLLTATHLCTWLDNTWQIFLIHNPDKKILGIGESTNGGFVSLLERGTNFSLANPADLAELDATLKYGSKFVDWRAEPFVNPLLSGNIAIHFNNRRFRDFIVARLDRLWPEQFRVLEADVTEVQNYADHVSVSTSKGPEDFDYVVDCTGTPASFTGYTLSDCTLVDRCRVHRVEQYEYEPFTDHIATEHGWMFGVPLKGYKTYGYLYHSGYTDTHSAEEAMMKRLGTSSLEAGAYDAHYAFRCYYANELISGRVCRNGNKALFFEPLIANSMFLYMYATRLIFDHVVGGEDAARCNSRFVKSVQEMEDVISYYYQGGSTFETPFWTASAARAKARLEKRKQLSNYFRELNALKQRGVMLGGPPYAFSPQTWQIVDASLGYRSFEALTT